MIAFAIAFGRTLTLLRAPDMISGFVLGISDSRVVITLVILVIFFIVGMVMDIGPVIVIMAPILLPIVRELGVDPVHFGIFMVVNLAISMATPPFGLNVFVTSSISGTSPTTVFRTAMPFIVMFTIALLFIAYVPQISLLILGRA
jgi:C4-dicarboxylate transporter DctM subunit